MTPPSPGVRFAAGGQSGGELGMRPPESAGPWQPTHMFATYAPYATVGAAAIGCDGGLRWSIFSEESLIAPMPYSAFIIIGRRITALSPATRARLRTYPTSAPKYASVIRL